MAPGGGKAGWGTGSSSGTACNIHTGGVLVGHNWGKGAATGSGSGSTCLQC